MDSSISNLELIGEGTTTKIYRDGEKAIKLYVNAPPDEADNEAKNQIFAHGAGLPVPAVYGVRVISDTETALEMAYINGKPLMSVKMEKEERHEAIRTLSKLQSMVHTVNAAGLPKQTDRLRWKIKQNPDLDDNVKVKLLELLSSLDRGKTCLCHGDFHPLNILFDGERHWIIDWVDAVSGSPLADACRTYIIFRQHLTRSSGIYLREFCREAKVKQDDILAWLPVIAAARLKERMSEDERALLMGIVSDWYKGFGKEGTDE